MNTNQEILTKAIRKAIDGGWTGWSWPSSADLLKWRWEDYDRVYSDGDYEDYETINVEAVIFNHDFAKALWGTEEMSAGDLYEYGPYTRTYWKHHLKQMVVSPDPIKYLGEHLDD